KRRHTIFSRDWSSDVCSTDLTAQNRTNFVLLFLPLGLNFYGDLKTSSRAGFVELGYQITDLLKLTAGARYTVDDKQWHLCNAAGAYTNLSNLTPGVCDGLYENDEDEWDALRSVERRVGIEGRVRWMLLGL